jgi:hypothetical protein
MGLIRTNGAAGLTRTTNCAWLAKDSNVTIAANAIFKRYLFIFTLFAVWILNQFLSLIQCIKKPSPRGEGLSLSKKWNYY